MKKSKLLITFVLILALSVCSLVSCAQNDGSGTCRIVIRGAEERVYTVSIEEAGTEEGVYSLLAFAAARESFPLDAPNDVYGRYIRSVADLVPDAMKGEFVTVYTSVASDFDVSEYCTETTFDGVSLKSAGVGISQMKVEDGAVYLFALATF